MNYIIQNIFTKEFYNSSQCDKNYAIIGENTTTNEDRAYKMTKRTAEVIMMKDIIKPGEWIIIPASI